VQNIGKVLFDRVPWGVTRKGVLGLPAVGAAAIAAATLFAGHATGLLHVDFNAVGPIAVGINAVGILAVGGINALGVLVAGGVNSLGVVSVGGVNGCGLLAIGGVNSFGVVAIGGRDAFGLVAIGSRAYGFYALGRFMGRGQYVLSPDRRDWGAAWFFRRWCPTLFTPTLDRGSS
jgi:hypothetical protein